MHSVIFLDELVTPSVHEMLSKIDLVRVLQNVKKSELKKIIE